jgi:hypothetical protein
VPVVADAVAVPKLDVNRLAEILVNAQPNLIVQVAELRRFSIDSRFESATGMLRDPLGDAFDVTLNDGVSVLKCLLSTQFNAPIRFGVLKCYDIVRIKHVTVRYDELRIGGDNVVIVDELEVLQHYDGADNLPILFHTGAAELERRNSLAEHAALRMRDFNEHADVPLVGSRDYYLTLLDSSTPLGKQWRKYDIRAGNDVVIAIDQAPLSRVLSFIANGPKSDIKLPPLIVGRIVQKSNLVIYSSPDKLDKHPMYFSFNIADASATVKVVCWTSTCFRYFYSVNIGDVVALSNFRVQQTRAKRLVVGPDEPDPLVSNVARNELGVGRSASQLSNAEVEIVINPSNPEGRIRTLSPAQLKAIAMPPLVLNLSDSATLNHLPQFGEFDACGVVVFVGRLEVERARLNDEGAYSYRWLQLRDQASPTPLCVRWACNGRADVLDSFKVGDVVALTDLKLMSLEPGAVSGRHYAKATYFSQVMKGSRLAAVAAVQHSVRDVQLWATSMGPLHWSGFAHRRPQHNSVFMRPPPDCAIERYMQITGGTLVPLRELDAVFGALVLHEHRNVLVQGRISSLKAVHKAITLVGGRHEKRVLLYDVEVNIVDLNLAHQAQLLIPESVYSDRDGTAEDKAADFTTFANTSAGLTAEDLEVLLRAGSEPQQAVVVDQLSKPIVFALDLCNEPRGASMVIAALFDPAKHSNGSTRHIHTQFQSRRVPKRTLRTC